MNTCNQGPRELGNIAGGRTGGRWTGFLTNFWQKFDQLSEDLILSDQCLFKGIFRSGIFNSQKGHNDEAFF